MSGKIAMVANMCSSFLSPVFVFAVFAYQPTPFIRIGDIVRVHCMLGVVSFSVCISMCFQSR